MDDQGQEQGTGTTASTTDAIVFRRIRQTSTVEQVSVLWTVYGLRILFPLIVCAMLASALLGVLGSDESLEVKVSAAVLVVAACVGIAFLARWFVRSRLQVQARLFDTAAEHEWLTDRYWVSQGPGGYVAAPWSSAVGVRRRGALLAVRFPGVIATLDLRTFDAPEAEVRAFVDARLPAGLPRSLRLY